MNRYYFISYNIGSVFGDCTIKIHPNYPSRDEIIQAISSHVKSPSGTVIILNIIEWSEEQYKAYNR